MSWNWHVPSVGAAMLAASTLAYAAGDHESHATPDLARRCTESLGEPQRLRVRMVPSLGIDESVLALARAEVETIWRRYQVEIVWEEHWRPDLGVPKPDLFVQFVDGFAPTKNRDQAIAWISFAEGQPLPYARISRPAAMRLLATKSWHDSRALADSSADLRNMALGRIIGRALAHEIGHFLLASRTHAENGLMRATIDPDRLVHPGIEFFRLENDDVRALRAARLASCEVAAARANTNARQP